MEAWQPALLRARRVNANRDYPEPVSEAVQMPSTTLDPDPLVRVLGRKLVGQVSKNKDFGSIRGELISVLSLQGFPVALGCRGPRYRLGLRCRMGKAGMAGFRLLVRSRSVP